MAKLFVIGTPIGNRQDLSLRAIETLREVGLIVSEVPRSTKKILDPNKITTKMISIFVPGKRLAITPVLKALEAGTDVALVSEAGTPGINDPGSQIVAAARGAGHLILTIPGPNAAIAAASISGFPMDEFAYKGFVPNKKGRQTFFVRLVEIDSAIIFYESVHRIEKTLKSLAEKMPDRYLLVARELTKVHEQSIVGLTEEIAGLSEAELPRKGEFVLVLAPKGFVAQHTKTS